MQGRPRVPRVRYAILLLVVLLASPSLGQIHIVFAWDLTTSDLGGSDSSREPLFATGSFSKSTGGAPVDQSITGIGFQPKAIILIVTDGGRTSEGYEAPYHLGVGYGTVVDTNVKQRAAAATSSDNVGTSVTSRRRSEGKVLIILDPSAGLQAEASLLSLDSNGFTLRWTTNTATATLIQYVAIGGSSINNANADHLVDGRLHGKGDTVRGLRSAQEGFRHRRGLWHLWHAGGRRLG